MFLHIICNLRGFWCRNRRGLAFLAAQGVLWYLQCPGYDNLFEPDVQGVAAVAKDRLDSVEGLEAAVAKVTVAARRSRCHLRIGPGAPRFLAVIVFQHRDCHCFFLGQAFLKMFLILFNFGAFGMKLFLMTSSSLHQGEPIRG